MLEDDTPSENYALRLTEALEAISSVERGVTPRRGSATAKKAAAGGTPSTPRPSVAAWFKSLDKLPPIRLPMGPAIPWRVGLPALIAVVAVTVAMSRPSARADAQGVQLPKAELYAVQQEAPLFTNSQQTQAPQTQAPQTQAPADATAPSASSAPPALGVQEPAGLGFDAVDIGFKLIAVLALAYGSMLLLKRIGFGGVAAVGNGGGGPGMRVVSSLALAPNRSVHVLKVPGGKTLLVGATPNQVNLIADLGELAEDDSPEATSFFDVLKGKLNN
jgi:flagellar biosynthetic protein FliO